MSTYRVLLSVFFAVAWCSVFSSVPLEEQAARSGKGVLLLQTGSDWCVSGEAVRKVFTSQAFKRLVGKDFILAVYDEMDNPTAKVAAANKEVASVRVPTRRFPAITCISSGTVRFYAQIENVPMSVTPEKLASAIKKVTLAKDKAEELFKKAASIETSKPDEAAMLYGKGFMLLYRQAGAFYSDRIRNGYLSYDKQWAALQRLDAGDKYGWIRRFTMGSGVEIVERANKYRQDGDFSGGAQYIASLKSLPQEFLETNQKQCFLMAEYALWRTDKDKKESNVKLLEEAFSLGRDTFWGQCAMGYLILSGKNIERKKPYRAPLKNRPKGAKESVPDFPFEKIKRSLASITPSTELTEEQKLNIARYAVLRRMEERGWSALADRKGAKKFLSEFMNNRTWLEDFAWSGPCDGYNAVLALETLYFQDGGRWVTSEDDAGRRFATALALEYSTRNEEYLADFLDAYRTTYDEGRLHKYALTQPVWQWRFAIHQGQPAASCDYAPAQMRFLSRYVNMPEREYGGACWLVPYRLFNCFGESVHGPGYYAPWAAAGEWEKRRYSPIVGGVCGELSKFGSACANSHGLPSSTAGQPAHCAYTRRRINGVWEIDYAVTYPTHIQLPFWKNNIWPYVTAMEGTFEGDRELRHEADRYIELAHYSASRGAKPKVVETFYRLACKSWPSHYNAWNEYGQWVNNSGASLDTMRIWARGCARGMKTGRQPVWDLCTPYFSRVAKEKGPEALADALVSFAPYFRQSDVKIQEEADFRSQLKSWTEPLGANQKLKLSVLKAMLSAQYGTRDYFSQTLGWGGEFMMSGNAESALFIKTIGEVVAGNTKKGEKPSLDFNPLILEASKSGNLAAFRQLAELQNKIDPFKGGGTPYPLIDFGGSLLSREGLLKTSSTCGWDRPAGYARTIDESPCTGNGFHTDKEDSPWAEVVLAGPAEICGIVVENKCGAQNQGRQAPLEVLVSEDGQSWQKIYADGQVKSTYRVDLGGKSIRAKYVRVQRTAKAKQDVYHLSKILVYGKKLY